MMSATLEVKTLSIIKRESYYNFSTCRCFECLRRVLFDIRAGNSNLANSLSEKANHAMYQDENPHTCFAIFAKLTKLIIFLPF